MRGQAIQWLALDAKGDVALAGFAGDLVEEFLQHERPRLSFKTINEAYGYPLRRIFAPFCDAHQVGSLDDLTPQLLDELVVDLRARITPRGTPISPNSVRSYMKSVNQLLSWARKEKGLGEKVRGQLPRKKKTVIDPMTLAEMKLMEDKARSERDKLIIAVLAATGAREGEVAGLTAKDLIARERKYYIKVDGKTGERMPPIDAELYRRLKTYAEVTRPRGVSSQRLFIGLRKQGGAWEPLTGPGIRHMVKAVAGDSGLTKRIYPHLFKHSRITQDVRENIPWPTIVAVRGCSLQMIMEVYSHLGHEDHWDQVMQGRQTGPT